MKKKITKKIFRVNGSKGQKKNKQNEKQKTILCDKNDFLSEREREKVN